MFKKFISIVLLLALINFNLSRFTVYAGFELNKKYISENFCVNKNRPWLQCNGKCYFMKKIHEAEENEKKQSEKDGMNRLEIFFFHEHCNTSFQEPVIANLSHIGFIAYIDHYKSYYLENIFHPPKTVV